MDLKIAMSQIGRSISVEIFQFFRFTFTFRMDLLFDDLISPDSTICNFTSSISFHQVDRPHFISWEPCKWIICGHMCPVCNCHLLVKIHDNFLKSGSSVLPWAGRYILTFPVPISFMILASAAHSFTFLITFHSSPDLWTVEQRSLGAEAPSTPLCG